MPVLDWHGDIIQLEQLHAYLTDSKPDVPSDAEVGVTTTDDGGWGLDNTMADRVGCRGTDVKTGGGWCRFLRFTSRR